MAQMPVKNTIPGKEVVLLPEMSDRAFWEHCMAIEQRERIIALGSQVLISSPVLPGEKLYAEYFRNGNLQIAGSNLSVARSVDTIFTAAPTMALFGSLSLIMRKLIVII